MDIELQESTLTVPILDVMPSGHGSGKMGGGNPFAIPFGSVLCLDPLIELIEGRVESPNAGEAYLAKEVMKRVAAAPELRQPIEDMGLFQHHKETADLMMLFLMPPGLRDEMLFKISLPFHFESVYESPAMMRFMQMEDVCFTFGKMAEQLRSVNLIQSCLLILRKCYGFDIKLSPITMLKARDPESGLQQFYKPVMNDNFIEVKVNGELPTVTRQDYERLLSNIYDRDLWMSLLPADKFEFRGFMFGQLNKVTEEESLSQLKHKLLRRDAVLDIEKVRELADLLRIHFDMPDLQLGLTAVDYPAEYRVNHTYKIHFNLLADQIDHLTNPAYGSSIYHRAFAYKEVMLIEDLSVVGKPTILEEKLAERGFRSILIAPLVNKEDRVIGLVELASPKPFGLNSFMEVKFREIMGLFRTAVARSRDEVDNRLEAILREQYTSLHPSVEWRFIEAAYDIFEQRSSGQEVMPEEIKFDSVYPLYGQADIVSSSQQRNEAIHGDLVENLEAARTVLLRALDLVSFPLINQVILKIDQALAVDAQDFNNSDETRIAELLFREVNPLIKQLGKDHGTMRPLSDRYFGEIDNELQLIYRRRKNYEVSVARLNKELSRFFEDRDRESQKVLPHYFEKYKTDGVEYEIYAGQSLLRKNCFSEIHLRNLRLSQLVDMCEATRLVKQISSETPLPLETAQLVFAYTSSLNIHFRMDEKRFDVDGAYNVRYEILKKRIDKATIHGGKERLTISGTVSIVYLHDKDRTEYLGYLEYLRQSGYVAGEVEEFVLDPLQSVQGLRAMRFRVSV